MASYLTAFADEANLEPYQRPDILTLKSKYYDFGGRWESYKIGQLVFIAEILEFYPGYEIYFLARDCEYMFDMARLLTQGTEEHARIHLLNISRASMADPNLMKYLEQNGVSEKSLQSGRKALFVDTGFRGQVIKAVEGKLSEQARANFKGHMVLSLLPEYPSSYLFFKFLYGSRSFSDMLFRGADSNEKGTIGKLEEKFARYTYPSRGFSLIDGIFYPMSSIEMRVKDQTDRQEFVSKAKAVMTMQSLKWDWQHGRMKKYFSSMRAEIRRVSQMSLADLQRDLSRLPLEEWNETEAILRDIIASRANAGEGHTVRMGQLGLKEHIGNDGFSVSSRDMKVLPLPSNHWLVPFTKNLKGEVDKVFLHQDWNMVDRLVEIRWGKFEVSDNNFYYDLKAAVANHLYDQPATGRVHELQMKMIELGLCKLRPLAHKLLFNPKVAKMLDLVDLCLNENNHNFIEAFADVFAYSHAFKMPKELHRFMRQAHPDALRAMVMAIAENESPKADEYIRQAMIQGNREVLWALARSVFAKPFFAERTHLLDMLIEVADDLTLKLLQENPLTKDHVLSAKRPSCVTYLLPSAK